MRKQEIGMGLGVLSLLLLLIVGCGGGGGNGGGGNGGTPVTATITGTSFVAVQDGKTGTWQRLSGTGSNYNFNVRSADGRYSVAWVCEGTKPQVNIVHTTTAETPSLVASCTSTVSGTINVSGSVQGLRSGETAFVAIGDLFGLVTFDNPFFTILNLTPGSYDIIAVRSGSSGPNKVWLQRNERITPTTDLLPIDFNSPDSPTGNRRVFDVSAGGLTVSGADSSETVVLRVYLQSSTRSLLIGLTSGVGRAGLAYPIFPDGVLGSGESFRIEVNRKLSRGVVLGLGLSDLRTLSDIPLPEPFNSNFDFTRTDPLAFTVEWSPYAESPVRGYRFTLGSDPQSLQWTVTISAGWLGSDSRYTTPVLNTLSGWESAWDFQRGSPVDTGFQVWVSSGSFQQVLDYERTGIAPSGFQWRFATRSSTLTPR